MDRQVEVGVHNGQTGRCCSTQGRGYSTQVRKGGGRASLDVRSQAVTRTVATEMVTVTSRLQAIFL